MTQFSKRGEAAEVERVGTIEAINFHPHETCVCALVRMFAACDRFLISFKRRFGRTFSLNLNRKFILKRN